MKYALIGCGRVAPNHIKAAALNALTLAAVCDIRDENITEMFRNSDPKPQNWETVPRYADYERLYDEIRPALVSIALPSGLHAAAALAAIKRGIHVIIEKPIAMSLEDADAILAAAKQYGVTVGACHQNRFNLAVQEMRKRLENGDFGRLSNAAVTVRWSRGESYYRQADWRGTWENDGGTLMNQCIHGIDLLRWMCGDDLVSVYGKTRRQFHGYIEAEDVGAAVLEFKNGVIATVEGTVNAFENDMEEHLTLLGEKGSMKLGGTSANTVEYSRFAGAGDGARLAEPTVNVYGNGHTALFADVIAAIKEHRQPYVDAAAGRRALETVLAIYLSSKTGQPVTLPLKNIKSTDFTGLF